MSRILNCFLIFVLSMTAFTAYVFYAEFKNEYPNVKNLTPSAFPENSANPENGAGSSFYSNAESPLPSCGSMKPDRSVLYALLCPRLSEKYVASSDGTLWMYADNYFISFRNAAPDIAVRSVRGMKKGGCCDITNLMSSKEIFCSKYAFTEETYSPVSGFSVMTFHGVADVRGDILCARAVGYSSPVLYDFTRFFEKG